MTENYAFVRECWDEDEYDVYDEDNCYENYQTFAETSSKHEHYLIAGGGCGVNVAYICVEPSACKMDIDEYEPIGERNSGWFLTTYDVGDNISYRKYIGNTLIWDRWNTERSFRVINDEKKVPDGYGNFVGEDLM